MKFNSKKCVVIRCSKSPSPIYYSYTLENNILESKTEHKYLGLIIHQSLSWSSHITSIANRANTMLNFLRRNLSKCSTSVKASAYLSLVRPVMEYASSVWDPYQQNLIQILEKSNVELLDGPYLITIDLVVYLQCSLFLTGQLCNPAVK